MLFKHRGECPWRLWSLLYCVSSATTSASISDGLFWLLIIFISSIWFNLFKHKFFTFYCLLWKTCDGPWQWCITCGCSCLCSSRLCPNDFHTATLMCNNDDRPGRQSAVRTQQDNINVNLKCCQKPTPPLIWFVTFCFLNIYSHPLQTFSSDTNYFNFNQIHYIVKMMSKILPLTERNPV